MWINLWIIVNNFKLDIPYFIFSTVSFKIKATKDILGGEIMDHDLVWEKVLNNIKTEVNSVIFRTWFFGTKLISLENNKAMIQVSSEIHKTRLQDSYYYNLIQANLYKITNSNYELSFEKDIPKEKSNLDTVINDNVDKIITKQEEPVYTHFSNLDKHYTFDTFVVGNSNKLAQSASLAVAENPGKIYNPLFIFGNSGLGKTHLMHAIGNYIEENKNLRVLYVTSNQFIDDYVKFSRDDNKTNYLYAEYFKNKYQNIDVLIIDDIQFLATAHKTQDEFFHTFNILHDENKQIILSSDRSPNDLKQMEERLKTRFSWGLTINIYPPDLELRKNIIKKKMNLYNFPQELSEDVIDYVASHMSNDVRNLEGALNRLMAYSFMMGGCKITLETAVDALKDMINKGTSEQTNILKVQKVVADHFQISVDDLKSKKRTANIAFARQIAMFLSRDLLKESFERIGLEFGGKDHSTVIHSVDKIEDEINNNSELRNTIEKIKENLN